MRLHRVRPSRFAPRVELLEDRCVPTCTAFAANGLLTIMGTAGPDTIELGDDGSTISLLCDGKTSPQLFGGVRQVNVQGRGGNDTVRYDLFVSLGTRRALNVNLGAGDDRFLAFLNNNDLGTGGNLGLNVQGGTGSDRLRFEFGKDPNTALTSTLSQGLLIPTFQSFAPGAVNFGTTNGVDIALNASLRLNLNGGPGDNAIAVDYLGTIAGNTAGGIGGGTPTPVVGPGGITQNPGTLAVNVTGGGGSDVLVSRIIAQAGSTGRVQARESGGAGEDSLTLTVRQVQGTALQPGSVSVDARLDGGPGIDHCDRTPNVIGVNCEFDHVEPAFQFANPTTTNGLTPTGVPGTPA